MFEHDTNMDYDEDGEGDGDGRKAIVMQWRGKDAKSFLFYVVNFPLDLLKSQLEVKYVFEHDALDVF